MDNLEKNLKDLEALLEESWSLPFTGEKKFIVDRDKILEIIDNIRKCYPAEVAQAKEILAKKDLIEQKAKEESANIRKTAARLAEETMTKARSNRDRIISDAEELAKAKLDDQVILATAQKQASQIIEKAKVDAMKMHNVTLSYLKKAIADSERSLSKANELVAQLKSSFEDQN